jgi:hypothetical protein
VFYFGILADPTPPVSLACLAAGLIAKETGFKISLWAVRIALLIQRERYQSAFAADAAADTGKAGYVRLHINSGGSQWA